MITSEGDHRKTEFMTSTSKNKKRKKLHVSLPREEACCRVPTAFSVTMEEFRVGVMKDGG
jgi:hypothetical protein